jgi:hypothetical protein
LSISSLVDSLEMQLLLIPCSWILLWVFHPLRNCI